MNPKAFFSHLTRAIVKRSYITCRQHWVKHQGNVILSTLCLFDGNFIDRTKISDQDVSLAENNLFMKFFKKSTRIKSENFPKALKV